MKGTAYGERPTDPAGIIIVPGGRNNWWRARERPTICNSQPLMTLVLSCATPDYVFQVSDRQLTWITGPDAGSVKDYEANKAVLVGGRMAFGYTGLAEVGSVCTDRWLAQTVTNIPTQNLRAVCDHICDQATEAFRSMRIDRRIARHAFVGVGWISMPPSPRLQPILCTISNALGSDDEWLEEAADEFTLRVRRVHSWQNTGFQIAAAGQSLQAQERKAIWRLLRRCAKANAGPAAFARALVLAMDFVASRHATVGRSLMALSMPRVAVERCVQAGKLLSLAFGRPQCDVSSFWYVPPNRSTIAYGPHVAGDGFAIMGIRIESLNPDSMGVPENVSFEFGKF